MQAPPDDTQWEFVEPVQSSAFSPLAYGVAQQQQQQQHSLRSPQPSAAPPHDQAAGEYYRNPLMDGVTRGTAAAKPPPPPEQTQRPSAPRKPPASLGVAGLLLREQQKATATDRWVLCLLLCRCLQAPPVQEQHISHTTLCGTVQYSTIRLIT